MFSYIFFKNKRINNENAHREREDERIRRETEARNEAELIRARGDAESKVEEAREKTIRAKGEAEVAKIREEGIIEVEKKKTRE